MKPYFFNTVHLLRKRLKGLPEDIAMLLGLRQSLLKKARGNRILLYHGICRQNPLQFNTLFVKADTFEKQLQLYKKYFNIISLDDYYSERFSTERFNICLSFDDGFANNYQYVLPLLEKYEVPACFFITAIRNTGNDILWNDVLAVAYKYGPRKIAVSGEEFSKRSDGKYISSRSGLLLADILRRGDFAAKAEMMVQLEQYKKKAPADYWMQMTAEQVKKMADNKWVTIGSHSHYHNDMATLSAASAAKDMEASRQYLENITGKAINTIAFPYGSYTRETIAIAKKAGYSRLLTTGFIFPDDSNDATMRERLTINPFISTTNQLLANVSGHYS